MVLTRISKRKLGDLDNIDSSKKLKQNTPEKIDKKTQTDYIEIIDDEQTDEENETENETETETETEETEDDTEIKDDMETKDEEKKNYHLREILKPTNEEELFEDLIDQVYDGDFFEQTNVDEIDKLSKEELENMNNQLISIKKIYNDNTPSIIKILKMDVPLDQKQKLLEKMYCLANSDILSQEYHTNLKFLTTNLSNKTDPILLELEQEILKNCNKGSAGDSYKIKILKSKMSFDNKVVAYKKLEIMESYEETDTSEYAKYKTWMDTLLSIPFGEYTNTSITLNSDLEDIQKYVKNVRDVLDSKLSFLDKPKDQIINIVTQKMRNPDVNINAIGLHGTRGQGKCLGYDTPILMFDGSIKMVQDIVVGDLLMGDDSTQRTVMSLARGEEEMFKINHKLYKESYTVNKSHILSLKLKYKRYLSDKPSRNSYIIRWFDCDKKIKKTKVFYYGNYTDNSVESMQLFKKNVFKKAQQFFNTIQTKDVIDISIERYLDLNKTSKMHLKGFQVKIEFKERSTTVYPYIMGVELARSHKNIPDMYKINSRKNRLLLLAGLLDYNSTLCSNKLSYLFWKTNDNLNKDFIYLCKSLGIQCFENDIFIKIYGKNLLDIPVQSMNVCKNQSNNYLVTNINIESQGMGNYYGFTLDEGNHRFVLGNFIVTHNTEICKSIAKALNRPFKMISLGGESDASSLTGHGFTYIGSGPGSIINSLINTQSMDSVILYDELDKIGDTPHGKEIVGTLIHLTDSTTNNKYNMDKYFSGIEFDLSKVLFVFTYNDPNKIDKILADRLFKINIDNYTFKEKLEITTKHLIPNIIEKFKFNKNDISFTDDAIEYIVRSNNSDGMRDIKIKLEIIFSRINTLLLTNEIDMIVNLSYKNLYKQYKTLPVIIPKEHVDIFLKDSICTEDKDKVPFGMYI
jgi:ATP-dependent Lon protease